MSGSVSDDEIDLEGLISDPEAAPLSLAEQVVSRIDAGFDAEPLREVRSYIGASSVGTKCDVEIELSLRGFPDGQIDAPLKRIFRDGHRIETEVVKDLRRAGYLVLDVDETTGRQWRFELAGGHVVCNTDGLIDLQGDEVMSLLEIKSMKGTLFNAFKKHGVKKSHPKYWDQMMMMMGMGDLAQCLFIAYNKDTSRYWCQIVEYDPLEWAFIKSRIETVWKGEARKISNDPGIFACKFCFKVSGCFGLTDPKLACTTCQHAKPITSGDKAWWCNLHNTKATDTCADWTRFLPLERL